MMAKTKPFASRTDRLQAMNAALDRDLSRLSQQAGSSQSALLTEMVQYHLGLRKSGDRPGKRLRANLALLTCEAFGRRYAEALWAAVAVELVHNFSLVFDDVQDHDELRRGRPSVWKVWGTGQAINAGAALEALVTRAVVDLLPARYADRTRPALALSCWHQVPLSARRSMPGQPSKRSSPGLWWSSCRPATRIEPDLRYRCLRRPCSGSAAARCWTCSSSSASMSGSRSTWK